MILLTIIFYFFPWGLVLMVFCFFCTWNIFSMHFFLLDTLTYHGSNLTQWLLLCWYYRETARCSGNISDLDVLKSNQPSSSLTVSSNFEVASDILVSLSFVMFCFGLMCIVSQQINSFKFPEGLRSYMFIYIGLNVVGWAFFQCCFSTIFLIDLVLSIAIVPWISNGLFLSLLIFLLNGVVCLTFFPCSQENHGALLPMSHQLLVPWYSDLMWFLCFWERHIKNLIWALFAEWWWIYRSLYTH